MKNRPRGRAIRFTLFSLIPVLMLLATAEAIVRVRYFFGHDRDTSYLTTPFRRRFAAADRAALFTPAAGAPSQGTPSGGNGVPSPASGGGAASAGQAPSGGQIVFAWQKPCVDQTVFSTDLQRSMPRTWNQNCFRGDAVTMEKPADEYRIVFLGGSTVEDAQSDTETMTAQFKSLLPERYLEKGITVVNAGRAGFEAKRIAMYWEAFVRKLTPDLVFYYEAVNEQVTDINFTRVDARIADVKNRIHEALYYRWSMLYTYAVEKFAFATNRRVRFWKVDVAASVEQFVALDASVKSRGAQFVYVTQIVRFPRNWKNVDTFDPVAVDRLLDRLRDDPTYVYDTNEITALNQRLVVFTTIDACRRHQIPVVNILDEVEKLGEAERAALFIDIVHRSVKGNRVVAELLARKYRLGQ
jgi:hypothetical protein